MNGYQSDVNLENINYVGNFPIEHSVGGFGQTTGIDDSYLLTLDPPITQYRLGMRLEVRFNSANTGAASINVDGLGAVWLVKVVSGATAALLTDDLDTTRIYTLIYDGTYFQVDTLAAGAAPVPNATQSQAGIIQLASQAEVDTGANVQKAVTPPRLMTLINSMFQGRWTNRGGLDCASEPDYPAASSGDVYRVTGAGLIGGASGVEVDVNDLLVCHTGALAGDQATVGQSWIVFRNGEVEKSLGNPSTDGYILQSTASGVRSWRNINKRLSTSNLSFGIGASTDEENLGTTGLIPALTFVGTTTIEINISGTIQSGGGLKTLRVRIGGMEVLSEQVNVSGDFDLRIFGGKAPNGDFKGVATLFIHDSQPIVRFVNVTIPNLLSASSAISFSGQNSTSSPGSILRHYFMVRLIV